MREESLVGGGLPLPFLKNEDENSFIHSSEHSLLSTYYMPGIGDTAENITHCPPLPDPMEGETDAK